MNDKWMNVPVEEDTSIYQQKEVSLGGIDVLWQQWSWEGITGTTVVFAVNEVKELTDEQLKELVKPLVNDKGKQFTISHKENWVFVNFDFEVVG